MDDQGFLNTLNSVAREHRLSLPSIGPGETPSSAFLSAWAKFLELCVKQELSLSDERWQRLSVAGDRPNTRFRLEPSGSPDSDADFRVGLQLMMGMLGSDEASPETDT